MNLFKKTHHQVIRFDQNLCHAKVDDNEVLFVRVTDHVTDKEAKFEVPPTHVAVVIKGGGDERFYTKGTYDVFENKNEIKNWKDGISVDIIYMPESPNVKILWGTFDKFKYRDERSNKVVNVGARGNMFITISNQLRFYKKLVGSKKEFDIQEFKKNFSGHVVAYFADTFLQVVEEKKLTYDKFDANKLGISESVGKILSKKFDEDWGVAISNFIIEWVGIDDEDSAAVEEATAEAAAEEKRQKKLKEYLAELERLDDKQFEREKYLRQLEAEDRAAYYEVLKIVGHPTSGAPMHRAPATAADVYCPHCGKLVKGGDLFCSACGKRLVPEKKTCPNCGRECDGGASFCPSCGTKL